MIRQALHSVERALDGNIPNNLSSYFNWLSLSAPVFSVFGGQVKVITEPKEFYLTLLEKCQKANSRILLTSLYLGNGTLSQNLVDIISTRLKEVEGLSVSFLLDANRGSRGKNNSRHMLLPLLRNHPSCQVSLYHTPRLRGFLRHILPQRYNELVGLQHMKIYLIDDCLIISGANLSEDYFTNRQDRYFLVNNCPELANFYWDLVEKVSSFSFRLDPSNNLLPGKIHPYETDEGIFATSAKDAIWGHCLEAIKKRPRLSNAEHDTWLFPLVELPPMGVHQESEATARLLAGAAPGATIFLSTGYFNLTDRHSKAIMDNPAANFHILMAHPSANGFERAGWPAGGIPAAYTALAERFANTHPTASLLEYRRPGWTYHVKGLWLTPAHATEPIYTLIGSSNFGVRSEERDLESCLGVLTTNSELRDALKHEQHTHVSHCSTFTPDTAKLPTRRPPLWVLATLALFKSFF